MAGPLNRRSLVTGLAASPAAFAMPVGVALAETLAGPPADSLDAALVDLAAKVVRLADRYDDALNHAADLRERVEDIEIPRPSFTAESDAAGAEFRDMIMRVGLPPAGDPYRHEVEARHDAAHAAVRAKIDAATAAWEAERERVERAAGMPAADRRADLLGERLKAWTALLVETMPETALGLGAKARAWVELDRHGDGQSDWGSALARSVAHDAVRLALLK